MDDKFLCNEQDIADLKAYTTDIKNTLRTTYTAGKRFFSELALDEWTGEQKKAFVDFMDLILQYHGRLNGEHGIGNSPAEEAEQTLTDFLDEFSTFYQNSPAYKELEGIA